METGIVARTEFLLNNLDDVGFSRTPLAIEPNQFEVGRIIPDMISDASSDFLLKSAGKLISSGRGAANKFWKDRFLRHMIQIISVGAILGLLSCLNNLRNTVF